MKRRNTRQRQLVLEEVQSRCDHPTSEQIYQAVHTQDERISRGTVYRNLDILAQEGQLLEVETPKANRYDLRSDFHAHMVCTQCGYVCDAPVDYAPAVDNAVAEATGFQIVGHQTIFQGLCPACTAKRKENAAAAEHPLSSKKENGHG